MPIGDTFLEVVSPVEANTTAGRFLERRGGDGGYMVILQCDDLDADRRRLAELGVRSDGRGDGVGGIDLAVTDRPRVLAAARDRGIAATQDHLTICGTRIRLV